MSMKRTAPATLPQVVRLYWKACMAHAHAVVSHDVLVMSNETTHTDTGKATHKQGDSLHGLTLMSCNIACHVSLYKELTGHFL